MVKTDKDRALIYYREAALQGFLKAKLNYVRLLNEGYGSPVDYTDAYSTLYHSVIADKKVQVQAKQLLSELAEKMPEHIITKAKKETLY